MDLIHYRLPARARGVHPGAHASTQIGGGFEFRGHVGLSRAQDPRRIDIRASLANPGGELLVRNFNQRASITVAIIADLSASMGAPEPDGKMKMLAEFTRDLGFSAGRVGDRFGFIGCAERALPEFLLPPAQHGRAFHALSIRLGAYVPNGHDGAGLIEACRYLGTTPGLVFLVSDFMIPDPLFDATLASLQRHYVVPVLLATQAEVDGPAGFGFLRVRDAESAFDRVLWLRPALRARIRDAHAAHRERFRQRCRQFGLRPLILLGDYHADRVTRHFVASDLTP
ncbi:MAG: DUF58 domain-containing protein [Thiotrichales bacterium]